MGRWPGDIVYGSTIPPQFFQVLPGFDAAPSHTSDIPLLDRWGTPLFGPGSIHVAHTPDGGST